MPAKMKTSRLRRVSLLYGQEDWAKRGSEGVWLSHTALGGLVVSWGGRELEFLCQRIQDMLVGGGV